MKNEAVEAMKTEIEPEMDIGSGVLRIKAKIVNEAGRA